MGNTRRIKKKMGICLAKTGMKFGGSEVALIVDDPFTGKKKADAFHDQCLLHAWRSSQMNMNDLCNISVLMREKILSGSPLWN